MAANELNYTQIATILNEIMQIATGRTSIAPVNTSEFMSVAQTALKMGTDPLLNAISVVLNRTIFSIRPYNAKLASLQVDKQRFGAVTRKLKIEDRDWEDDETLPLEDGQSVDMFKIRKPKVLQTNFYGQNKFQRHYTIFKDQLDLAFTGPGQLGEFFSMIVQNCQDLIEQKREIVRRSTLNNIIVGIVVSRPQSCFHLIQEYNAATGSALTPTTVFAPENFKPFVLWAYAFIDQISTLLTERTVLHQTNITGHENLNQHTPYNRQRVFTYSPYQTMLSTMALSEVYNTTFIKMASGEKLAFWQSPTSPSEIQADAVYLQTDGTLAKTGATVVPNVFGCIVDTEALGVVDVNTWSAPSPFDAAGGYTNFFFHFTERYWNDFTEKGVVFLLD